MKKKLLSITLIGALLLSLTACGKNEQNIAQNENSNQKTDSKTLEEQVKDNNEITFENLTVVDNEFCKIELTGIDPDAILGYEIKASLENKSTDKVYMFSIENASVNGVQTDPYFAAEVAAGKKANDEITINRSELEDNGISELTDIELTFRVYDSNDWMADPVAHETVHVYPYGQEKATTFTREPKDTDNIIIDNESITITVIGNELDEYGDFAIYLFIQNKSDSDLMVSEENASLNGYMADPFWANSVQSGKCSFSTISWFASDLEANNITEVTNAEFNLKVYKDGDYLDEDIVNQTITLQF